ncbi:unnamed protein product [Malassezia sympodialis ATCC 42132]|uniref:Similar to S.cerevisiae protein CUS1 (Protein required for assembly of U2 snRNP into the spliceosome) n=1 Tax=Malassezia sympodialis (strain ATCC 42132) TaxID=1230383 RepID=M5E4P2_MALS4|nr:uncharacterized protein MSY001_0043 [Malassezia sympodialis ATCC 42132]CCU97337.1 unnamed protein product [Malassezia sympodialis ATCC 42132]SHO77312.1 Similar to S.cerevisiae protein CUS1 (Protein required for assembly of U2 snRNP into the spliceosome) [Malassezia sympodialis ATCC 42132]|eukprot:XP_018738692.1 uncharacterized protein MSY001_0043 [Malassezia sympodialis ATCC 42132]
MAAALPAAAPPPALSKNAKRRAKKKQQREQDREDVSAPASSALPANASVAHSDDVEHVPSYIEPAPEPVAAPLPELDPAMAANFSAVLERFQPQHEESSTRKGEVLYADDMYSDDEEARLPKSTMSRRKLREIQRMSVAELKKLVRRPEVVEWADVASPDPRLLIHLKSYRNTVPVPTHWTQKREYLAHRRGMEKPPYELPSYIAETGIATLRSAVQNADANKTLKAKTRERVQPKLGRMDIDYQRLHDAFFRFQTKPPMTRFGETFFEGKDGGSRARHRRPGDLSPALREALSIPPLAPLPWLIAMQRHGPPPSYPHMRIPGLNAPIPEGAQWGFHPGGWGRPPLDDHGNPIYGDVYGQTKTSSDHTFMQDPPQRDYWGELPPEEEDMEEESEDEDEEDEEDEGEEAMDEEEEEEPTVVESEAAAGLATPSGIQTVMAGLETPAHIELRKPTAPPPNSEKPMGPPPQLYHVLPERKTSTSGQGLMGSDHLYDVRAARESDST